VPAFGGRWLELAAQHRGKDILHRFVEVSFQILKHLVKHRRERKPLEQKLIPVRPRAWTVIPR
jgi:hypothetical protein